MFNLTFALETHVEREGEKKLCNEGSNPHEIFPSISLFTRAKVGSELLGFIVKVKVVINSEAVFDLLPLK